MGWVLMQPADDEDSIAAMKLLSTTYAWKSDLTREGARLRPIGSGSRCCLAQEKIHHSFVGEEACGR